MRSKEHHSKCNGVTQYIPDAKRYGKLVRVNVINVVFKWLSHYRHVGESGARVENIKKRQLWWIKKRFETFSLRISFRFLLLPILVALHRMGAFKWDSDSRRWSCVRATVYVWLSGKCVVLVTCLECEWSDGRSLCIKYIKYVTMTARLYELYLAAFGVALLIYFIFHGHSCWDGAFTCWRNCWVDWIQLNKMMLVGPNEDEAV